MPDKLAGSEGHTLDQHQAIIPQPGNERAFSVASERGTVQIDNGRITIGG
jgi:hypothetical protein